MRYVFMTILLLQTAWLFAQTQMVLTNDVKLVMQNDVMLVVDNSNPNAISTLGTGGNIISEDEDNIIKWNIGTGTGTYTVPFATSSGVKIPLQMSITAAGTGSGSILYSTYGGATWNNDTYRPTGVVNMTNMAALNNSSEVIDRFWMLDAQGYTTKPTGAITFTYADAEHLAIGNTISEADLKAERYDEPSDNWELFPVGGVVNTTNNTVSGVPFNSTDLTRSWTLVDQTTHLLPVVLVSFDAICETDQVHISWSTAQEIQTDHFDLQTSSDGVFFETLTTIPAAGYSTTLNAYDVFTQNIASTYYRLFLYNMDGSSEQLGAITKECNISPIPSVFAWSNGPSQLMLSTNQLIAGKYQFTLFSLSGQLLLSADLQLDENQQYYLLDDKRIASGIYVLRLSANEPGNTFQYVQKVTVLTN